MEPITNDAFWKSRIPSITTTRLIIHVMMAQINQTIIAIRQYDNAVWQIFLKIILRTHELWNLDIASASYRCHDFIILKIMTLTQNRIWIIILEVYDGLIPKKISKLCFPCDSRFKKNFTNILICFLTNCMT